MRHSDIRRHATWVPLAVLVLAEIAYPLVSGDARARLVVGTVLLGYACSVAHAALTRGARTAAVLVAVTAGGGFAVEALGVGTGFPFGEYGYGEALGPRLAGVPLVIPLAWTWMAWPAWLAAGRITAAVAAQMTVAPAVARVPLAGLGLAAWDLFLDPQMVAEGYWRWADPEPGLPGVPAVPVSNYLGWLGVGIALMALLARYGGPATRQPRPGDAPMLALYLWTYASSVLAHAVFLGLPASALWGGLVMGTVAVPLSIRLAAGRRTPVPA